MDLISVEDVKEFGGIQNSTDDPIIQQIVTSVSHSAQTYMNRLAETQERTEVLDVGESGYNRVYSLKAYPISSVTSVKYAFDGDFASVAAMDPTFYRLNRGGQTGRLTLCLSLTPYPSSLQVVYTGGLGATPSEVKASYSDLYFALVQQAYKEFKRSSNLGLASQGSEGSSTDYRAEYWIKSVEAVLNKYKRLSL